MGETGVLLAAHMFSAPAIAAAAKVPVSRGTGQRTAGNGCPNVIRGYRQENEAQHHRHNTGQQKEKNGHIDFQLRPTDGKTRCPKTIKVLTGQSCRR